MRLASLFLVVFSCGCYCFVPLYQQQLPQQSINSSGSNCRLIPDGYGGWRWVEETAQHGIYSAPLVGPKHFIGKINGSQIHPSVIGVNGALLHGALHAALAEIGTSLDDSNNPTIIRGNTVTMMTSKIQEHGVVIQHKIEATILTQGNEIQIKVTSFTLVRQQLIATNDQTPQRFYEKLTHALETP